MSDNIYLQLFSESTSSPRICQYVQCKATLTKPDQNKFCNLSCCNRQNALRQKAEAESRRATNHAAYEANPNFCITCEHPISWISFSNSRAKYCSNSCASKSTNMSRSQHSRNIQRNTILKRFNQEGDSFTRTFKEIYYSIASFKFDVYHYPDLLNLDLLEQYGWYATGGRRKDLINTTGVTRDHIMSINQGIQFNIHPLLLSHPVNCRILSASDNSKKSSTSSISIEHLVELIVSFKGSFKHQEPCMNIIHKDQVYITDRDSFVKIYSI